MTFRELYDKAADRLSLAGIEEASLDARLLLEYVFEADRNLLLVHGGEEAPKEQAERYLDAVETRAKRVPLQHITGVQNFMGLDFLVNEHVLIPRQDTEILVEEVLMELHDGMSVLDMCTGSGAILISLIQYKNDCTGVGSDVSEEALLVARENADRILEQEKRRMVSFVQGDLFEHVEGKFDRIVSNPPYICADEIDTLMPEVREHEPKQALNGGADGLMFYRKIVTESRKYLHHGGMLYFEIGYNQKQEVMKLMEQEGFAEVTAVKDYAGLDRVVYGTFV